MTRDIDSQSTLRVDKWLWAARFFKTRGLAAQAVSGGKVQIDGARVKPAKGVRIGNLLSIRRDQVEWEVVIQGLSDQRRPATEAQRLYLETESSQHRRETLAEQRKFQGERATRGQGRPGKRDRRRLIDLRRS